MVAALKQDSNNTGLSVAEEASPSVLPMTPIWYSLEPNSYKDWGGQYKTVARQTINSSRQRQKGVQVDLDASGGFQFDLTSNAMEHLAPGVFFANYRSKSDLNIATTTTGHYAPASGGAAYKTGDIIFGKGFTNPANNGRKVLAADGTGTSIAAPGVIAETGASGIISRVGKAFASGDATIAVASGVVTFGATAQDLTTLGLSVGEWIFVGGDDSGSFFATGSVNGYGRIGSISAIAIVFDKWSQASPTADDGSGKTIQIYFGRLIHNELAANIVRRTYQFERSLGKADSGDAFEQAEYLPGSSLDELDITLNTADKITCDLSIISAKTEQVDGDTGPKSGTRPLLVSGDAYNTTSDVVRFNVSVVGLATALFGFCTQGAFTIKNNVKPNKAISVLGSFDQTAGTFEVAASVTAYFVDVQALEAIRLNSDVTVDCIIAGNNTGVAIDYPLVALGEGRLNIALNEPITLPLTMDAATAAKINPNLYYTASMSFFDYLPNLAMPA